jgi:Mg/Co/Ni transporter MgtE
VSPRAACRLETLGFVDVHDYVPGKADWLAHNLPVERETDVVVAGQLAREDVVTCGLSDTVGDLAGRLAGSPYGFALVLGGSGVLLGRLRSSALDVSPDTPVEQRMEGGPTTVRPDTPAGELAQHLADRDLETAIVTTPEGRLIGVARRDDLERGATPSR